MHLAGQQSDSSLLAGVPDFIALPLLMKATPAEEGAARILYLEASNENEDFQEEVVLSKALADSAGYYLRHGNVDISHYTVLGPRSGLPNFLDYEIGRPVDVRVDGKTTFVKAELYRGASAMAQQADRVWQGMTAQQPPQRWYPSVGGKVLEKSVKLDASGHKHAVVSKVLWTNTALDRNPINHSVPEASMLAPTVFMKSLGGLVMKGLEAGYGTDSAALVGGAALRRQSLEHRVLSTTVGDDDYDGLPEMWHALADDLLSGRVGSNPGRADVAAWLVKQYGLHVVEAEATVERFLRDLHAMKSRRSQ